MWCVWRVFCLLLTSGHLAQTARNNKVFGADPHGGFWAATVSERADGVAHLLEEAGYTPEEYPSRINSLSFDHTSNRVLLETSDPHQLSYAPLCSRRAEAPRPLLDVSDTVLMHDPSMGDCLNCETSAFTLHGSSIYFLLTGEYTTYSGDLHRVAQIRRLLGCEQCGARMDRPFTYADTISCSDLVVEVLHDIFNSYNLDAIELKGGKNMKIHENETGHLDFFFHFANITRSDREGNTIVLSLWHAGSDGTAHALNHTIIDSRFADWTMSALGSVDYKDETLCWSTGTLIMCGDYGRGGLRMVKVVMGPAGAVIADVCRGDNRDLLAIVSGVAVLRGGDERVVAFGCYPDQAGQGGAGILRIPRTDEDAVLQPLSAGQHRLVAGAVLSHRHLSKKCDFGEPLPVCLGPQTTTQLPVTTTEEVETTDSKPQYEVVDEGGQEEVDAKDSHKGVKSESVSERDTGGVSSTQTLHVLAIILPIVICVLL